MTAKGLCGRGGGVFEWKMHRDGDRLKWRDTERELESEWRLKRAAVASCWCGLIGLWRAASVFSWHQYKCSAPSGRWRLPIVFSPRGRQRQRSLALLLFFYETPFCSSIAAEHRGISHRIPNQHIRVSKTIFNGTAPVYLLLLSPTSKPRKTWSLEMLQTAHTDLHRFLQMGHKSTARLSVLHGAEFGSWTNKDRKKNRPVTALSAFPPAAWQPGLGDRVCDNQAPSHQQLV